MKWLVFIFVFNVSFLWAAPSDSITIYGNAPEYANMHLTIQYQSNFILKDFKELKRFLVNKDGAFQTSFYVDDITKIYIPLGETQGFLFVEPSKKYHVVLPPYQPLKPENKLNPFFIPESLMIGVENEEGRELNINVQEFESFYNKEISKGIQKIVLTGNRKRAFDLIEKTEAAFPADSGSWFYYYKQYTYGNLRSFIYSNQKRKMIGDYFADTPVQYSLNPYWDSFNDVFKHFFSYYFESRAGEDLKKLWSSCNSFDSLKIILQKDSLFVQDNLAELILIKVLYDGYYSNIYDEDKVIGLIDKASHNLYTLTGKKKGLGDFKGKFVYLNFANTQNYACKKDFQVLEQVSKLFKKDMVVVTVLTDEDPDMAQEYIKNNKLKWTFLHFNQNAKVLFDYDVKAYPTYYLINPEGKLVLSPSPAPEENFVPVFSEMYNAYRYNKLRRERPRSRTIYDL
jgi:thiol-disulfide isomerase/thioredoxin